MAGAAGAASSRTLRVGVVADTHVGEYLPALPAGVAAALAGVDLIIHVGDLTCLGVLDDLRAIAPVVAVCGNHDRSAGLNLPQRMQVRIGGVTIGVTHGVRRGSVEIASALASVLAGRPRLLGMARQMRRRFPGADCVVFGHLHLPVHREVRGALIFSPGAVYVVEADPDWDAWRLRARLYRRSRRGVDAGARRPHVGILDIRGGAVTARRVPVPGPLRRAPQPGQGEPPPGAGYP